jgi:hypothetical protein
MPTDTITLAGLAIAAIVAVWLVFSILRKMFGIVLLIALAVGAYVLWTNPDLLAALLDNLGLR